ncbi:pitrilysin family protein [Acaryochloris sp. IP29b_bin.137]|uniref:M16 family metallopeptidase n=1 Tax=Acaryochloris sp. IP29b_bin.137 TaxID=2969217 RepID=UPI00261CD57B|nr:pitrilysin family protein [Acaryochloris sp. IP29b_bin.137]
MLPLPSPLISVPVTSGLLCQKFKLANGLVVLVTENPIADIIAARIFVGAGSIREPENQAGIAYLTAATLTKGTHRFSSAEIAEQVESVGASLGVERASDYFLLSLKTVSEDFLDILTLAAELLRTPSFPEPEVELEKRLALQSIRSQQEQTFTLALKGLRQSLFPLGHPYNQTGPGDPDQIAQLQSTDLHQYHQTYFRPDNMVISLSGNLTPTEAVEYCQQVFGDWSAPEQELLPPQALQQVVKSPLVNESNLSVTPQPTQQSIVMLGHLAPSVQEPDYAALKLLYTYLCNGLSSRLFVELREKQGLAYEVSGFYPTRLGPSHFVVYLGTAAENTAISLTKLQAEIDRLRQQPLPDEELATAKSKLLGQYVLGKQSNAQLAHLMGWYEALGLGIHYDQTFPKQIECLKAETVYQAACQHLYHSHISLVGSEAAMQPWLKLS